MKRTMRIVRIAGRLYKVIENPGAAQRRRIRERGWLVETRPTPGEEWSQRIFPFRTKAQALAYLPKVARVRQVPKYAANW